MSDVFSDVDYDPFADAALARVVPSTESQREVWLADQLSREASLAYNESVTLHLRGQLDVVALRAALQALVERHDSLRATFGSEGATICIADSLLIEVPITALDQLSAGQSDAAVAQVLRDEVDTSFDLERGPLLRARLLKLHDDESLLFSSVAPSRFRN